MEKPAASAAPAPRRHRWLPEFLVLSQGRRRSQIRILGFSVLVGFAAGVAAIVFYLATHITSAYAMGALAGYRHEPRPAGESGPGWLPPAAPELHLWMLIAIPAVGGLLKPESAGLFAWAPGRAEGARHRFGDCRLSSAPGLHAAARSSGQDRG